MHEESVVNVRFLYEALDYQEEALDAKLLLIFTHQFQMFVRLLFFFLSVVSICLSIWEYRNFSYCFYFFVLKLLLFFCYFVLLTNALFVSCFVAIWPLHCQMRPSFPLFHIPLPPPYNLIKINLLSISLKNSTAIKHQFPSSLQHFCSFQLSSPKPFRGIINRFYFGGGGGSSSTTSSSSSSNAVQLWISTVDYPRMIKQTQRHVKSARKGAGKQNGGCMASIRLQSELFAGSTV